MGTFLTAYLACLALIVYPSWYVQAALGQYWSRTGGWGVWRVLPLCYGLGTIATVLSLAEVLAAAAHASKLALDAATTLQQDQGFIFGHIMTRTTVSLYLNNSFVPTMSRSL